MKETVTSHPDRIGAIKHLTGMFNLTQLALIFEALKKKKSLETTFLI